MQRELKVNFPPIAVSKGKGKTGMAPSRKITLALIFLGDCPNFLFIQLDGSCLLAVRKAAPIFWFFLQGEKVNYEKFRVWLLHNKDAFTFSRWLLSGGVYVTLTDDSDTPTFYQTLAGVTHCE